MATTIIEKEEKLSRKEREKEATKKELIGVTLDMLKIKQKKILDRTGVKEKVEELNNQFRDQPTFKVNNVVDLWMKKDNEDE